MMQPLSPALARTTPRIALHAAARNTPSTPSDIIGRKKTNTSPCAGALLFHCAWLSCALVAGCSSTPIVAQRDEVFVHIRLVDAIDERPDALGLANCNNGVCYIQILRDRYPDCITHEVRHGFEANWHEHRETTDYCLVQR
ncbi:hypothetical protein A8C75_11440 [Marinobacterium aestuarii]|uniref:Uncharacterized protein n=1 Tax=Marinobacterium aestuarii TaxID=1821621 RepID=A0A1A9EY04_9GAMM|nr:hypothetical protein [Marinobacterium aestuarii]ANG63024.1 hypothetical protein A8C75_11440 [Marinobacterium aestuarii]